MFDGGNNAFPQSKVISCCPDSLHPFIMANALGDVPEGSRYRLTPTAGTVSRASANFYRSSSSLFRRLELP
ncbi:hypothetical protein ACVWZX_003976 [Deinococcus sp. UYEF24]